MGRARKIEDDQILDAAERVVERLGAAGLSIDAVAKEAGVSKSRVVYDHKSKRALLEALIERRLDSEQQRIRAAVAASRDTPNPELFGRLAAAGQAPSHTDRAVMLAISASLPSQEDLQNRLREWTEEDLRAIASGSRPRAALIAYLALTGFFCTELFGFHQWEPSERLRILDDMRMLFASFPEPT